jgi:hypothetical protein
MKDKKKASRDEPLKVPFKFDDAMKRALAAKPPPGGWAEYEKKLKRQREQQRQRRKAAG